MQSTGFGRAGARPNPRLLPRAARVWSDKENSTKLEQQLVYSMDDENLYGPLLHTLNYAKAVDLGLVADTKLLILAYDQDSVARDAGLQKLMDANAKDGGIPIDDLTKIIGIWRASQGVDDPPPGEEWIPPLSKMLLFTNTIKRSKAVTGVFAKLGLPCTHIIRSGQLQHAPAVQCGSRWLRWTFVRNRAT